MSDRSKDELLGALAVLGVTYRQLDYWARKGALRPDGGGGSGRFRRWSRTDLAVTATLGSLVAAIGPVSTEFLTLVADAIYDAPEGTDCVTAQMCERSTLSITVPWALADAAMTLMPEPVYPAQCGTRSGYFAHKRRKEPTCSACRSANTQYMRSLRATA